jgi:hypothetical protein
VKFFSAFSFPPPPTRPAAGPSCSYICVLYVCQCHEQFFPTMGQHYIWGSHPLYTTAHIAGSTKGKRRRRRRCSCRSLIRLSSVRHELSDKGRLCDSFYFFSLAVLLLLLLLRYIHSTHSIWNADESPSSIHRRRDCIHKYTEPPSSFSCVSFGR